MSDVPVPSGTVVVMRDGEPGLEVLLLERRARRGGRGGASVFPGGKIEATDRDGIRDPLESARRAAVREAREEAGVELQPASLVAISRWITPELAPRRFDTWFFAASLDRATPVRVDGHEISSHRWLAPATALDAHRSDEIRLAPPTFVTVEWLTRFETPRDALVGLAVSPIVPFRPRICRVAEGACMLYPGDAGYRDGDVERAGPRHRLWALPAGYRYERSD